MILNTNVTSVSGLYTGRIWCKNESKNKLEIVALDYAFQDTGLSETQNKKNMLLVLKRFQL